LRRTGQRSVTRRLDLPTSQQVIAQSPSFAHKHLDMRQRKPQPTVNTSASQSKSSADVAPPNTTVPNPKPKKRADQHSGSKNMMASGRVAIFELCTRAASGRSSTTSHDRVIGIQLCAISSDAVSNCGYQTARPPGDALQGYPPQHTQGRCIDVVPIVTCRVVSAN